MDLLNVNETDSPKVLRAYSNESKTPLSDDLKRKKTDLEERLKSVNEALAALEQNPGVEKVLNLVSKASRG